MAEDYRSIRAFPAFKEFTGAVTWTKIQLPANCSRVQVGSTGALWISGIGVDGGTVGANDDKGFIVASNYLTFLIGRGSTRDAEIFVASQSGTPKITILMEE